MHRLLALLTLALCAITLRPAPALADPADIEAAARSVVRVVIVGNDGPEIFPISHGTGFAVGPERIVTNAHVVQEAVRDNRLAVGIVPADGDRAVYARIVAVSPRNDLALLATTEALGLSAMTISGNPVQNGTVTAIGYPANVDLAQGLSFSDMFRAQPPVTSTGFLSGRRPSREFDTLLHTAPIAAGNSGGPLVDQCGRVLGVNSFGAESGGSEAEFFFAVSTRELLPFLRANDVAPRINSTECRSLADIEEEEAARAEEEREAEERRADAEAEALAQRTAEIRRQVTYEVFTSRSNRMLGTVLLLLVAMGGAGVAAFAHRERDLRLRAIGGGAALVGLAGAAVTWLTQPGFASIETRVEEAIRETMEEADSGTIDLTGVATSGTLACVLDPERSRIIGDPAEDIDLTWSEDGCVNGRTQYGLSDGRWTRVLVPANEAAVSINSFDPEARELVMERYLLDRVAMTAARSARGGYEAPSCDSGREGAIELGTIQDSITGGLPDRPNERLVYRCSMSEQTGAQ